MSVSPATSSRRPRVRLVQLPAAAIHALAQGDLAGANATSPVALTAYFVGAESLGTWRRRSSQLSVDPDCASWITGAIFDEDTQLSVGRAGFHGPPDAGGRVEIGYAVDPPYRRRGYARAAVEALLDRAATELGVRVVRASVRPDNLASLTLVRQYGFVAVGEQEDDEDGLETIYEVSAEH